MHRITLILTILVTVTAGLQRDALLTFEELDYADEDIYFARPVAVYKNLNFGSNFGGTTTSRIIETRANEDFVPKNFDLHSFAFGCVTLNAVDHKPQKPVMCSLTVKGYSSSSSADLVARQTFDFKPAGKTKVRMKKATLDPAFRGLKVLLLDTDSKKKSLETAFLMDDMSITIYGEQRAPPQQT